MAVDMLVPACPLDTLAREAVEEPEKVDERRKAAGLPPLAESVKPLESLYGKAEKK